ncbi:hypothetical protein GGU11DRAFT_8743 [Lentinula aff. detonsa]|nr:hypothetical protein GGU11DRAFT_8743 [Lentinula aff. detonsa]
MRFLTVLLPFITLALHVAATDLEAQESSPAQQPCTTCIQKAKEMTRHSMRVSKEISETVYDNWKQYRVADHPKVNTAVASCFFVGTFVVVFYVGAENHWFGRGESDEHGSLPNCQHLDCSTICAAFYCRKIPNMQGEITRRQSIGVGSNWIDNWKMRIKHLTFCRRRREV